MHPLFKLLAWCVTGSLIMGGALRLSADSLRRARNHPGLFLRVLLVLWIGVPILAIAATRLFQVRELGSAVLLLVAICPGVPVLIFVTRQLHGEENTALIVLILTAVTAPLLTPLWAQILSRAYPTELMISPRQVTVALIPTVFAPLGVGIAVRAVSKRAAWVLARIMDVLFLIGVALVLVVAVIKGGPVLLKVPVATYAAMALTTLGSALLGYWAGGPAEVDRKATSLAAALGNPALALVVLNAHRAEYDAVAIVTAYVLVRALILVPFKRWLKPRTGRAPTPARSTPSEHPA
jgi:BASS family bile acid:Na+ symporter